MNDYENNKTLYRSRRGMIFGVCQGMGDYLDFSVFWLRAFMILTTLFSGVFPMVLVYVVSALVIKPEPVVPFQSQDDHEFYNSYVSDRTMALYRLKKTFDGLERRIRRMEDIVTARDYDWESRLNR
jgi:phage shock protein C